jgi:hypothetical protein
MNESFNNSETPRKWSRGVFILSCIHPKLISLTSDNSCIILIDVSIIDPSIILL